MSGFCLGYLTGWRFHCVQAFKEESFVQQIVEGDAAGEFVDFTNYLIAFPRLAGPQRVTYVAFSGYLPRLETFRQMGAHRCSFACSSHSVLYQPELCRSFPSAPQSAQVRAHCAPASFTT